MNGRRVEQQLSRRAAILTTTRALIAARGDEGVTMRDIARACKVAVATLYNQFGSKEELLALSADELFRAHAQLLQNRSTEPGVGRLLAAVQLPVAIFEQAPAYCRAILANAAPFDAEHGTGFSVTQALRLEFVRALDEMQQLGQLVDWIDVPAVVDLMMNELMGLNRRWARGSCSLAWLRERRLFGAALLLSGVTLGDAQEQLGPYLRLHEPEAASQNGTGAPATGPRVA